MDRWLSTGGHGDPNVANGALGQHGAPLSLAAQRPMPAPSCTCRAYCRRAYRGRDELDSHMSDCRSGGGRGTARDLPWAYIQAARWAPIMMPASRNWPYPSACFEAPHFNTDHRQRVETSRRIGSVPAAVMLIPPPQLYTRGHLDALNHEASCIKKPPETREKTPQFDRHRVRIESAAAVETSSQYIGGQQSPLAAARAEMSGGMALRSTSPASRSTVPTPGTRTPSARRSACGPSSLICALGS